MTHLSLSPAPDRTARVPAHAPSRTRPVLPAVLLATLTAFGSGCAPAGGPGAPAPAAPSLAQRLTAVTDSIMATPPYHRTHWGVLVHDPAAGTVFDLNGERNFVPASNMKLVTGAVALAELGEGYRYRTELVATGHTADGTAARALVVRGSGDPTLSARFHGGLFAALDSLADSVAVRGLRRLERGVVVDASRFTDGPLHFAWFLGNLPSRYAAGTAAFGIEEGALLVVLHPGATTGTPARAEILPYPGVADVEVRVVTGAADAPRRIATDRLMPGDTLLISGTVPLGAAPDTLVLAAPDPAILAARALAAALAARGIELGGPARVARDTAELRRVLDDDGSGAAPAANTRAAPAGVPAGLPATATADRPAPLLTWTSPPLAEIVPAFMLPSQNWIAEQLVKTVGAESGGDGSWSAGIEAHGRFLEEVVGLDPSAFFLRDGSGLSNQSLITPAGLVALLEHARTQPWFPTFYVSLPRPGQAGGTLSSRLHGLEEQVAAKTGTITHVNGLSGYIVTDAGRELTFAILTNATGAPAGGVRDAMDRIVREIAGDRSLPR
jgi:serine-type D-Ala-D-Ala carboxypeptidase/endopeptidase (penicillin-binding protein 4)